MARVYYSEIESLTSLIHPNIICVYQCWESSGLLYLILEYAPGGSLRDRMRSDDPLSQRVLRGTFRQIISALAYCHSQGIAHRDIKPANILLDAYGRPKVADFGLSGKNARNCGSMPYKAPELLESRARDAFACDVWALGITFYELVVGQRPFTAARAALLLHEIAIGPVKLPPEIGGDIAGAIERMLAFDPRMRPTMVQLLEMPLFSEQALVRRVTSWRAMYGLARIVSGPRGARRSSDIVRPVLSRLMPDKME
jgi:serine/threonine protein kinase